MPGNVRQKKGGDGLDQAVSIRLDPEIVARIDAMARESIRNRTQQIEYLMKLGMKVVAEREAREAAATEDDRSHQTKEAVG